jgi:cellobiose phosphorylase
MSATWHFDDATRRFICRDPLPPAPWINYLGNRRLKAFISQQGGGLLWYREPATQRITRYHYTGAPPDRPGFYVYVRDLETGDCWNPHFAPASVRPESFACIHEPGITRFESTRHALSTEVAYTIANDDDVMCWKVKLTNLGDRPRRIEVCSYMEFGLLEFLRESEGWCYLKNQFGLRFDPAIHAIRYDYHVFEAPHAPRMLFACTESDVRWECGRDAFIGLDGHLGAPAALRPGRQLENNDLTDGGHACAAISCAREIAPGASSELGYVFALAPDWEQAERALARYRSTARMDAAFDGVRARWADALDRFQVQSASPEIDRMINTWTPVNAMTALDLARTVSTDHMGTDGLRFRDTAQDALAVAHLDPAFSRERLDLVLATQTRDGGGCFAFYPHTNRPIRDVPHRSDNPVWPVYTVHHWLAETGERSYLDAILPYRDGGAARVWDHLMLGLRHIEARRGPHGLPLLFDADWNDSLALFGDPKAESVMLGMQFVYACRLMRELGLWHGEDADVAWCARMAEELKAALNTDAVWDGRWYRRLLFSNGSVLGGAAAKQGRIYLNPQSWSVISGVGDHEGRGVVAMDAAAELLDTECGLRLMAPPFTGYPEPDDPPIGANPGIGENGGIFCHANTWAIMAEALLGRAERAMKYYRQLLPENVIQRVGLSRYGREPYVYVSSLVGPDSPAFGKGGISWLTGTAGWMYVACTQYLLGVQPTLEGRLDVKPCLPAAMGPIQVRRRYRGETHTFRINQPSAGDP